MGIVGKMFGKANNQQEQKKAEDKKRYNELLSQGMRPSEALHRINYERNRAREKMQSQPQQPQSPKSRLQRVATKVIAVDKAGRKLGQHIKESGFLTPPRNTSESFLDFSRTQSGSSFLDFSKVRNESIFGGGGSKRQKKAKKHKKQKSKSRDIVLRISR